MIAEGVDKSLNKLLVYMNIIFQGIKSAPVSRTLFKLYPHREFIPS